MAKRSKKKENNTGKQKKDKGKRLWLLLTIKGTYH